MFMEQCNRSWQKAAHTAPFLILALSTATGSQLVSDYQSNQVPKPNLWVSSPVNSQKSVSTQLTAKVVGYKTPEADKVAQLLSHRPNVKRVLDEARSVINAYFNLDTPLTIEYFPADDYTSFASLMVYIGESDDESLEDRMSSFDQFDIEWLAHNFDKADGIVNFSLG